MYNYILVATGAVRCQDAKRTDHRHLSESLNQFFMFSQSSEQKLLVQCEYKKSSSMSVVLAPFVSHRPQQNWYSETINLFQISIQEQLETMDCPTSQLQKRPFITSLVPAPQKICTLKRGSFSSLFVQKDQGHMGLDYVRPVTSILIISSPIKQSFNTAGKKKHTFVNFFSRNGSYKAET